MNTVPSSTVPTADFGSRFSAFMIDAVILFVVQWMVVIVLSRQLQAVGLTSTEPCAPGAVQLCEGPATGLWVALLAFLLISTVGYHALFEGRYGATPGKRWMGLVVVDRDNRMPIGWPVGVLRSLFRQLFWLMLFFLFEVSPFGISLPPILFILLPVIGIAMVGLGAVAADGRSVHDRVASTRVVRTDHLLNLTAESSDLDADKNTSALIVPAHEEPHPDPEDSV